jgi:hypothetical protein
MSGRVFTSASFAALVTPTALAWSPHLPLTSTAVSRTLLPSLDAVQAQVDAVLTHAAASKDLIGDALAQPPPFAKPGKGRSSSTAASGRLPRCPVGSPRPRSS